MKRGLKIFYIVGILGGIFLSSCSGRDNTVNCFPEQHINVQIDLNLPAYASKLDLNNWIYITEQQSGTRGLILVRTGTYPDYKFKVYDRNAPHICPDVNTTLEVQGDIKLVCPKDNAEWILSTGEPIKVSGIPPKTYNAYYNAATGIISISSY